MRSNADLSSESKSSAHAQFWDVLFSRLLKDLCGGGFAMKEIVLVGLQREKLACFICRCIFYTRKSRSHISAYSLETGYDEWTDFEISI